MIKSVCIRKREKTELESALREFIELLFDNSLRFANQTKPQVHFNRIHACICLELW